ncbi:MAG: ABC transporter permease [Verrucomicrobia bacterium]|nr:ABC transporter permease [Verrucomicrobiota bacterium]
MRFELAVCLRYLAPKRGRLFVSITTLFSILGLAVGVTTYITVVAVMTGLGNQITNAYTGYYSDLIAYKERIERGRRVFAPVDENDEAVIEKAAAEIEGVKAASPFVYGKVNLRIDQLIYPFDLRGVDPERERLVSTILAEHKLQEGDFSFTTMKMEGGRLVPVQPGEAVPTPYVPIVIGQRIAEKGNIALRETLKIESTRAGLRGPEESTLDAYVAGIFSYGNIEQDLSVYTTIEVAQVLQGLGGSVHRVSIKLADSRQADRLKPILKAKIETMRRQELIEGYLDEVKTLSVLVGGGATTLDAARTALLAKAAGETLTDEQRAIIEDLDTGIVAVIGALPTLTAPIESSLGFGGTRGLDNLAPIQDVLDAVDPLRAQIAVAEAQLDAAYEALGDGGALTEALDGLQNALGDLSYSADGTRIVCAQLLFQPFEVVTWSEINPDLFRIVKQERFITAMFVILIVVVAGFTIISGLSMTVVQKRREIGILRAMGASSGSVAAIFGLSGLVVGLIGTVLGTAGGLLLSENFNTIRNWIMPGLFDLYETIPIAVQMADLAIIWSFALVWSVVASIVPAVSAARLRPAEALRWE